MTAADPPPPPATDPYPSPDPDCPDLGNEDTQEIPLTPELLALIEEQERAAPSRLPPHPTLPPVSDLLDSVADWPAVTTDAGPFRLTPVRLERDLTLLTRWINDPAVAEYWELAGEEQRVRAHLEPQLAGDGRSVPCLGVLDGVPMSYWELYRADLDPLARSFPVRPHDTGVHLLLGPPQSRGRGLGTLLLRAVATLVLEQRPTCARVLAEPDVRNTPSLAAFLGAGFRFMAEASLPEKKAAIMVHDRLLRDVL